ncbi:MAG TPA: response regulator transcription factor [Chryseosolibacter sp.]|nr:response regulator transcription factor [Chryseosolibacter sp.]
MNHSPNSSKIKVLIVDDHRLLRDGLAALLKEADDIEVVGSVASGEDAISIVPSVKPDVVLMDIMMGGMTGIEATRWIKEQDRNIKVVIISSEIKKELVTAGIQCGIDGYLPKDVDQKVLVEAIRTVRNGGRSFNEAITNLVFEDFYQKKKLTNSSGKVTLPNDLTKREQEVLALVACGKTNHEIADELFISIKTVDTHKSHILDKLGLKNTAELVRFAIKNNLITLD